mgnify:CR=1 FL=1
MLLDNKILIRIKEYCLIVPRGYEEIGEVLGKKSQGLNADDVKVLSVVFKDANDILSRLGVEDLPPRNLLEKSIVDVRSFVGLIPLKPPRILKVEADEDKLKDEHIKAMLNDIVEFVDWVSVRSPVLSTGIISYLDSLCLGVNYRALAYSILLSYLTSVILGYGVPPALVEKTFISPVPLGRVDFVRTTKYRLFGQNNVVSRRVRACPESLPLLLLMFFNFVLVCELRKPVSYTHLTLPTTERV